MESDADIDVRAKSPLDRLTAWLGPPRGYALTRWLILRLLAFVYVFAFLGILVQGLPLLGSHGLTPAQQYVDWLHRNHETFWDTPSLFMLDASDTAIIAWAIVGLVISAAVLAGYANLPMLLVLWFIYGSYERVGQLWWAFGWEIQLLETTLLAAFLVHPYDPRPLRAPSPPNTAIVLMRWLVFRIMLGAGLIKWRGDACWRELTCLDAHFETQPIPNPLSAVFHQLPHPVLAGGVVFNHIVELVLPWFAFGPRIMRLVAACGMASFQIVLILSGNLAFLNWLTLIPVLACFDDDFLLRLVPTRARTWLRNRLPPPGDRDFKQLAIAFGAGLVAIVLWGPLFGSLGAGTEVILALVLAGGVIALAIWHRARIVSPSRRLDGHQLAVGVLAALVALKSCVVVDNLAFAKHQAMNRSYDRLALVNTYGAFGSVDMERHELIIEGTRDSDPATATWRAYELPCKPGDLARRPCVLGPFHRRLDWLIWFSAMEDQPSDPWVLHLVWKLLDGDRGIRTLLAVDPFDGAPPTWIRIRRFIYHLQPLGADTWWTRDHEEQWLPPVSVNTPELVDALAQYGWPSPTER
jgi:lipase maturation factor